jgi:hypothetical protein
MSSQQPDQQPSGETVRIDTTLGDLIEAVTNIAMQAGQTEQEGYKLAAFTIEKLLREKRHREILSS